MKEQLLYTLCHYIAFACVILVLAAMMFFFRMRVKADLPQDADRAEKKMGICFIFLIISILTFFLTIYE